MSERVRGPDGTVYDRDKLQNTRQRRGKVATGPTPTPAIAPPGEGLRHVYVETGKRRLAEARAILRERTL